MRDQRTGLWLIEPAAPSRRRSRPASPSSRRAATAPTVSSRSSRSSRAPARRPRGAGGRRPRRRDDPLVKRAEQLADAGVMPHSALRASPTSSSGRPPHPPRPAAGDEGQGEAVERLAGTSAPSAQAEALARVVVVNVSSTEAVARDQPATPASTRSTPPGRGEAPLPASSLYALRPSAPAARSSTSPPTGARLPALERAARRRAALGRLRRQDRRDAGQDRARPDVRDPRAAGAVVGRHNMLGGGDGATLADPGARASKARSKAGPRGDPRPPRRRADAHRQRRRPRRLEDRDGPHLLRGLPRGADVDAVHLAGLRLGARRAARPRPGPADRPRAAARRRPARCRHSGSSSRTRPAPTSTGSCPAGRAVLAPSRGGRVTRLGRSRRAGPAPAALTVPGDALAGAAGAGGPPAGGGCCCPSRRSASTGPAWRSTTTPTASSTPPSGPSGRSRRGGSGPARRSPWPPASPRPVSASPRWRAVAAALGVAAPARPRSCGPTTCCSRTPWPARWRWPPPAGSTCSSGRAGGAAGALVRPGRGAPRLPHRRRHRAQPGRGARRLDPRRPRPRRGDRRRRHRVRRRGRRRAAAPLASAAGAARAAAALARPPASIAWRSAAPRPPRSRPPTPAPSGARHRGRHPRHDPAPGRARRQAGSSPAWPGLALLGRRSARQGGLDGW